MKVWHIVDYELVPMESTSSHGQFYSRDTYVIRWEYRVTVTGRDLKGQASHHGVLGRDRYCYYLWIGAESPPTEQGATALNTRDLDEERGPQMRILQGHEPPAFISLFQGRMVIHDESSRQDGADWRLFYVRGETESEACLHQVARGGAALRSRGSLLLIQSSTSTVFLWHGSKSLKHSRNVASAAAKAIQTYRPAELHFAASFSLIINC